jgi:hypothetical protein
MKRFVFSLGTCLSLLVATSWLIATPAYASPIIVSCGSYSLTCEGPSCTGQDSSGSTAGYCSCTKADGTNDTKICSGPAQVQPVENNY